MISEAERMWGKAIIRPSNAEEVRQEFAPSGGESDEERDENVGTFRDEASIEGFVEEGTPRTPSSERPKTLTTPLVLIVKWGMKPPKNHVQLLIQTKLKQEQLRGGILKNQRLLSERVFGIHRALVSESLKDRGLMPRLSLPKQICIPKLLLGTGPILRPVLLN